MSEKYGFVYIWFDKKYKRYYVGSHWGTEDDGYVCSSNWMRNSFRRRPEDFKRRILSRIYKDRTSLLNEEQRWLSMIKDNELNTGNSTQRQRDENVRYYNVSKVVVHQWHSKEHSRKTIGQKISASKKGKSTGPCSSEKAAKISEVKKKNFAERGGMSEQHKKALTGISKGPHTEEWKQENSKRMKEQWSNGTRKRAKPKSTMSREEQDKLSSVKLKNKWADPIWAESQRLKLKEAWNRRKENYK